MTRGRKYGFAWGVMAGFNLALAAELHWHFVIYIPLALFGLWFFRDNDIPLTRG